jgi:hypothetical protein
MLSAGRLLAALVALTTGAYALAALSGVLGGRFDLFSFAMFAAPATVAGLAAWFALRGDDPGVRARWLRAGRWARNLGLVAFAVGFFGPIAWAPDANQGPLLGIFITGPLGFVVGALLGLLLPPREAAGARS